jgi:hypothetical protein
MQQNSDTAKEPMNQKNSQILKKIFIELPIHAQLNTKYCQMREEEFDFYTIKYVREEETPRGASEPRQLIKIMVTRLVTKAKKLREEEEENKRGVSSEDG